MPAPRQKWGLFLCECSGTVPIPPAALEPLAALVRTGHHADALPAFAAEAQAHYLQHALICCAEGTAAAESAFLAHGTAAEIHGLDLAGRCFAVHTKAHGAADKARRLVEATMRAVEARPEIGENVLTVGERILMATDTPAGLELARELERVGKLFVFADGTREDFEGAPANGVNWGRVAGVEGRLGRFAVTLDAGAAANGRQPQRIAADQVVLATREPLPFKARAGLHRVVVPEGEAFSGVAERVRDLIGTFAKPEHVTYDESICAGGSAEHQACGLCVAHCPYDAIARREDNPLRVRVDHLACEGCGACASACPTSALRFTEPSPAAIYEQLSALLAPGAGENDAPPPLVLFHCEEEGRRALEYAGRTGQAYPASVLPVQVPCLRYVSEAAILTAMRMGAGGVALLGCEDCPNGERELLYGKLEFSQTVLDALGLARARVRLITSEPGREQEAVGAVAHLCEGTAPSPVRYDGRRVQAMGNREAVADAIAALLAQTGRESGGIPLPAEQPYAFAHVEEAGCTLCRSCANVCPTHAFIFDEGEQALRYKHIACVGCGLCETVCPEGVVSVKRELYLEPQALEYLTVAQDEMIHCLRCEKPFINRRALETIEARVLDAASVLDTFAGSRRSILRMCPECRAVAAMQEVERGWTP